MYSPFPSIVGKGLYGLHIFRLGGLSDRNPNHFLILRRQVKPDRLLSCGMKTKLVKYLFYTLLISIGIGILIQLNTLQRILDPIPDDEADNINWHFMFVRLFLDSAVAWGTFIINYYVIRPLDGKSGFSTKKVIVSIVVTVVSVYVLSDFFFGINSYVRRGTLNLGLDTAYFFKDLVVSAIILSGVYTIKILFDRQQYALENEQLMRENLESQYESLRTQISPHFLFNSLSALRSLITTNSPKGVDYLDHLSDVLRKTLQNQEEKTVSVADELTLLNSYIFLMKMRYEDNLVIDIDIPDTFRHMKIPHLALQTLVENAIKHNVISNRRHMQIHIYGKDNHLVVENSLNKKETPENGTGFGLSNLSRQYELISKKTIEISKTEKTFEVSIPLIEHSV